MTIEPRNDLVLVKRFQEEYKGLIELPDSAKEKPLEAEVIAVGPGRWDDYGSERIAIDLEVGDRVFIGRYAGMDIVEEGVKLLFIRESEILGRRKK